jgi:PP-loop superfamily ATP-utilizing enzyme
MYMCIREEMIRKYMIKELKVDKVNGMAVFEITKNDLRNLMDSVNNMVDKQQRTLLENLPSEESDRRKLDDYNALKEDLKKVWELLN